MKYLVTGATPVTDGSVDGFSTAGAMLGALRRGDISAMELLELHLNRIRAYNPALNAIVCLDETGARGQAGNDDDLLAAGRGILMLGLPLTIKDAIDVAGLPTTSGTRRRAEAIATADAPVVARVRDAGGVIMGKTNTPPLAGDWQTTNRLFGRTVNPWDPARTPGGSTGGGAAAVAAGLSPLEIGSDIGGSIRVPAAFCGIYGHRPSETAVPRTGHYPGSTLPNPASIFNVIGPLARDAGDLEIALDTIGGPEAGEDVAWRLDLPPARHERLQDFRVAVAPALDWLPVDPEIEAGVEALIETLDRLGARVRRTMPDAFGDLREYHALYRVLLSLMFSFNVDPHPERAHHLTSVAIADDDEVGARAHALLNSATSLLGAFAERERYRTAYRRFFRDWDVLISPVAPVPAFPHDDRPDDDRMLTVGECDVPYHRLNVYPGLATLPGQPATAFPVGLSKAGLPIGLQAIGPYLEDRTPIRLVRLLASELGGFRPPPGFE